MLVNLLVLVNHVVCEFVDGYIAIKPSSNSIFIWPNICLVQSRNSLELLVFVPLS